MFFRALSAEWTKLITTKSLYWITVTFFFFTVGFAVIAGYAVKATNSNNNPTPMPADVNVALSGMSLGGCIILIQAVMIVTAEYRHNYAKATFTAMPQRLVVALAKYVLSAVWAAIVMLIAAVASVYIFKMITGADFELFGSSQTRFSIGVQILSGILLSMFANAIAWITRQTAGAVSLSILWYAVLENLIGVIPNWGEKISRYLPFRNFSAFSLKTDIPELPWDWHGSLFYFIAWVLVLFGVGLVLLHKRDV